MDKFGAFKIDRKDSAKAAVPILKDAYAAYECAMVDDRLYGDHRLLVGEIVAVHYNEEVFMADGTLDLGKVSPVLYLGNEQYLDVEECRLRTVDRDFCVSCLKTDN
jgi:flavin reductase (DIM6/NTAB) family NADH-FMN oxidoreductase RutF